MRAVSKINKNNQTIEASSKLLFLNAVDYLTMIEVLIKKCVEHLIFKYIIINMLTKPITHTHIYIEREINTHTYKERQTDRQI